MHLCVRRQLHAPEDCPQGIIDLIAACMDEHPDKRPTAVQVFEAIRINMRRVSPGALPHSLLRPLLLLLLLLP